MTAMRPVRVGRPGAMGMVEVARSRAGPGEVLVAVAAVGRLEQGRRLGATEVLDIRNDDVERLDGAAVLEGMRDREAGALGVQLAP